MSRIDFGEFWRWCESGQTLRRDVSVWVERDKLLIAHGGKTSPCRVTQEKAKEYVGLSDAGTTCASAYFKAVMQAYLSKKAEAAMNVGIVLADIASYLGITKRPVQVEAQRSNEACVAALADTTRLKVPRWRALLVDADKPVCREVYECMETRAAELLELKEKGDGYPEAAVEVYRECCRSEIIDPLGRYFGQNCEGDSRIEIYWLSIGIEAKDEKDKDWTAEGLTEVVLLHEWAHAFTHLGQDADGNDLGPGFADLERPDLVEGLAQYWTHYASQGSSMRPEAFRIYGELMMAQRSPYRQHLWWLAENDLQSLKDIVGPALYGDFPPSKSGSLGPPECCPMNTRRELIRNIFLSSRSTEALRKLQGFNDSYNRQGLFYDDRFGVF